MELQATRANHVFHLEKQSAFSFQIGVFCVQGSTMPAPKGMRAVPFSINDAEAVHVYSEAGRVWLQLRRNVPTLKDIDAPSFKVAVTLTPEQAIAIAGELLTAATHHSPTIAASCTSQKPPSKDTAAVSASAIVAAPVVSQKPPAVSPEGHENRGKPWAEAEEQKLLEAYDAGIPIPQIAQAHHRGMGGIQSRLVKLGRMTRE